jgi:hypothetical protein
MNVKKPRRVEREITIERESCETDFTTLPNAIARDERLKPAAGFILYYILTKPPTWKVIPAEVAGRMKMKLPAVRKVLTELIRLGYGKRDFVRDDRKRIIGIKYFFSSRPKYLEDAPEAETGEAVMQKAESRQSYATVKSTPVLSNDSNKLPPKSPPEVSASAGERVSPPPVFGQNPNSSTRSAGNPSSAPPDRTTEGQPRKGHENFGEELPPVTLGMVKKAYELINKRKIDKADERWNDLTPVEQAQLWQSLDQLQAYYARLGKRPPELWELIGTRGFRQFATKRNTADPSALLARPPRPVRLDPHGAFETPLGLEASRDGWSLALFSFVDREGRLPFENEISKLRFDGLRGETDDAETAQITHPTTQQETAVAMARTRQDRRLALKKLAEGWARRTGHADPPMRAAMREEQAEEIVI